MAALPYPFDADPSRMAENLYDQLADMLSDMGYSAALAQRTEAQQAALMKQLRQISVAALRKKGVNVDDSEAPEWTVRRHIEIKGFPLAPYQSPPRSRIEISDVTKHLRALLGSKHRKAARVLLVTMPVGDELWLTVRDVTDRPGPMVALRLGAADGWAPSSSFASAVLPTADVVRKDFKFTAAISGDRAPEGMAPLVRTTRAAAQEWGAALASGVTAVTEPSDWMTGARRLAEKWAEGRSWGEVSVEWFGHNDRLAEIRGRAYSSMRGSNLLLTNPHSLVVCPANPPMASKRYEQRAKVGASAEIAASIVGGGEIACAPQGISASRERVAQAAGKGASFLLSLEQWMAEDVLSTGRSRFRDVRSTLRAADQRDEGLTFEAAGDLLWMLHPSGTDPVPVGPIDARYWKETLSPQAVRALLDAADTLQGDMDTVQLRVTIDRRLRHKPVPHLWVVMGSGAVAMVQFEPRR